MSQRVYHKSMSLGGGERGGERDGDGRERGEDGGLREEGTRSSRVYVTKSLSQVYVIGWGREGERGERGHDHDIMTLYITVPA